MDTRIMNISETDIPEAMKIIDHQGWKGYGPQDLQMILNISPDACYKMVLGDKMIGFIFSLVADSISYVSFFLIEKEHRGYNGGNELGMKCLRSITRVSNTVVIYANRLVVDAYLRKGFISLGVFRRYKFKGGNNSLFENVIKRNRDVIPLLENLNQECYRNVRGCITHELFNYPEATCFIYATAGGDIEGFLFSRKVDVGYILGPLVSRGNEPAQNLLNCAINEFAGYDLFADAPDERCSLFLDEAVIAAERLDLLVDKMYIGSPDGLENKELLYFIGGHHFS